MKKLFAFSLAVVLLCAAAMIPAGAAAPPAPLKFKLSDGSFKIIHVPDLQETIWSSAVTKEFLYDLAKAEQPDLFVLGGDNIGSGGLDKIPFFGKRLQQGGVDSFMNVFDKIYRDFDIPVTMVYGNHDNEAFNTTSRAESFAIYAAHESFIGAGAYVPEADEGTSDAQGQHYGTHRLPIYDSAGESPVFNLWMFDSGSYDVRGGYSQVQKPQLDWFKKENGAAGKLPSFAFQHIVVPEIYDLLPAAASAGDDAFSWTFVNEQGEEFQKHILRELPPDVKGTLREAPCPTRYNSGQLDILDGAGNVLAIFFGHDHTNTFELKRGDGPDLINTQCTGFGSYGDIDLRGVRVVTLQENDLTKYDTKLVTYQNFYPRSALRDSRLRMYQALGTFGNIVDTFSFRPLLWITGRFA